MQKKGNESTHIIGASSSYIDLILTSKQNLAMKSGADSSLHANCNHQITYTKFNLKTYYPFPYEQEMLCHEKTNVDHIGKSIGDFSLERCFANTTVNSKVHTFDRTIKKITSRHIPHEIIVCDDRDSPWIIKDIKLLILDENHANKSCIRDDKSWQFFKKFQILQ